MALESAADFSSYIESKSKIRSKKYFTNINVGKEKYTIISEIYDKDSSFIL